MSEDQKKPSSVEVIVPPNPLINRVTVTGTGSVDLTPVERAEQALEQLSVAFDEWIIEEVATLLKARDLVHAEGLTEHAHEKLYLAAHDLKGQAETYGYPLIAKVSSTLCMLLDATTNRTLIPLDIIDHHVNAVGKMVSMKMKSADHPHGLAVSNKLYQVVSEFAEHESKKQQQSG